MGIQSSVACLPDWQTFGECHIGKLISTHQVTSGGQISTWKKCLLEGTQWLFESGQAQGVDETALTAPLYEETGRLKVELDWLKKS